MSKTKKILSVILAVLMLMSVSPVAFAEDTEVSITHQPTAKEPYVELNDDTGVTYQWYSVDGTEITDRNATGSWAAFGYPEFCGEYDPGTGWIGYDDNYGWTYYFVVELEAGDTVNLEFSSVPDDVHYDSPYGWDTVEGSGTSYSFTATYSGKYGFCSENPEITVRADIGDVEYTEVEGQTSATLTAPVFGKNYFCEITTADSTVLTSDIVSYAYTITHQPTSGEPYVELNYAEGATYQWYTVDPGEELTDENATAYSYRGETASYNSKTGWTPVLYDYFSDDCFCGATIAIKEGDIVTVEFEESGFEFVGFADYASKHVYNVAYSFEESGVTDYTFTMPSDGNYTVHTAVPVNFKIYMGGYTYTEIDSETSATLSNPELGETYVCKVTTADSTVLTTEKMEYVYAITHQPTAAEPYVELNDNTDATYQWYKFGETFEITDYIADTYSYYGAESSYSEENGWTGIISEYDMFAYFTIPLEAGETVTVEVVGDDAGYIDLYDTVSWEGIYVYAEEGKTTYELTVYCDGDYTLFIENEATVKAYSDKTKTTYTKVDGETAATLTTTEDGTYICEVTFKDGTKEISKTFTPCAHTDADGDGICDNGCGYKYPAENTDTNNSDACDYCGKVHSTFIQKLFCKITEFFVKLFTLIGLW